MCLVSPKNRTKADTFYSKKSGKTVEQNFRKSFNSNAAIIVAWIINRFIYFWLFYLCMDMPMKSSLDAFKEFYFFEILAEIKINFDFKAKETNYYHDILNHITHSVWLIQYTYETSITTNNSPILVSEWCIAHARCLFYIWWCGLQVGHRWFWILLGCHNGINCNNN